MSQFDVVTFGEAMWRLSPPAKSRLETTASLDVQTAGSELNTAIALARLGKKTAWWSRLPDNPLGQNVAAILRTHNVNTDNIRWSEGRLGVYFVEFGSAPRPTQVYYDRADSTASQIQPDDFDWAIIAKSRWLHLTGITPALSDSCLATMRRAVTEAKQANTPIAFDINHRVKLWTMDAARPIYDEIAQDAALMMIAERDARALLEAPTTEAPAALLHALHTRWNGGIIVMTHGENGAYAYDGETLAHAPAFPVEMVDRVGAGDAFDAGILCAHLEGKPLTEMLRFAHAAAALKLTIPGDIALFTRAEVDNLFNTGGGAGIIR